MSVDVVAAGFDGPVRVDSAVEAGRDDHVREVPGRLLAGAHAGGGLGDVERGVLAREEDLAEVKAR